MLIMDTSKIKTLTASRLQVLQQVEAGVLAGKPEIQSVLEYLFAVSASIPDLLKAAKNKDTWKLSVLTFGDDIDAANLAEIEAFITADFERIEAASVQPVGDNEVKKD